MSLFGMKHINKSISTAPSPNEKRIIELIMDNNTNGLWIERLSGIQENLSTLREALLKRMGSKNPETLHLYTEVYLVAVKNHLDYRKG